MWKFDSFGPFEVPDFRKEPPKSRWRAEFWSRVDGDARSGLSGAIGCYIFCLGFRGRYKPYYVGKTVNVRGFKGECFEGHKLNHLSGLLETRKKYKPYLVLFPLLTDGWDLSEARSHGDSAIDWLETTLIGMAILANPLISNTSKTRFHREVYVHGLIGRQFQGRPSNGATFARSLFDS